MNPISLLRLAALCTVSASTANAAFTLTATQDNNVLRSAADTVQGTGDESTFALKQATSAQTNSRIGFLKFDLTGQTSTPGDENALFTFALGANSGANFTLKAFVLNAGATNFNWTESGITFNNRPAASTLSTDNYVDPTLATNIASSGDSEVPSGATTGTSYSFLLPNWASYVQSDNSITFILLITSQDNATPSLTIASSENGTAANRPKLVSVPEPSSAALLVLGGLFLARRKRS